MQSSPGLECGRCGALLYYLHYNAGEYVLACITGHIVKRFFSVNPE